MLRRRPPEQTEVGSSAMAEPTGVAPRRRTSQIERGFIYYGFKGSLQPPPKPESATKETTPIEPINGELIIYNNLIGSMTNSPTFDWHLTNLDNYINLSTYSAKPLTIRGKKLEILGQGSGLNGLPASFSSTSRFVRCSIFSANAVPPTNANELPNQAFHILNQFDIPVGSVRENNQGTVSYDSTQVTLVKDPNNLRYYFKSYSDQTIRYVDLQEFNLNANSMKSFLSGPSKFQHLLK